MGKSQARNAESLGPVLPLTLSHFLSLGFYNLPDPHPVHVSESGLKDFQKPKYDEDYLCFQSFLNIYCFVIKFNTIYKSV